MNSDKGIYTQVMPLDTEQTIAIGRNRKSRDFPQSRYVYVGSARGSGGLQRRTDQHHRRLAVKRSDALGCEQVLEGRSRSIALQNVDPVFDTVFFQEVISRLKRARGAMRCRSRIGR